MAKEYVLGFAFSENRDQVVLIEKQRPDWQKGSFNGVGGKIDQGDQSPLHAMIREFEEETGVETLDFEGEKGWNHFATMTFQEDIIGGMAIVYCFKLFSDIIYDCKTIEEERIEIISLEALYNRQLINNLPVLIPMALHEGIKFSEISY